MTISDHHINTFRWLSMIARERFNIPPEGLMLEINIYDNITDIVYRILVVQDNEWFMIVSNTNFKELLIDFSDYILE